MALENLWFLRTLIQRIDSRGNNSLVERAEFDLERRISYRAFCDLLLYVAGSFAGLIRLKSDHDNFEVYEGIRIRGTFPDEIV
jgi:hypothetical protein